MEELRRAGHRAAVPVSPWRFAPWAPFAILAIMLASGLATLFGGGPDEPKGLVVQEVRASALPKPIPATQDDPRSRFFDPNASADELQKLLPTSSDSRVPDAYFKARLLEAQSAIPKLVHRGDDLQAVRDGLAALGREPKIAGVLKNRSVQFCYDQVNLALNEATKYYHGGAPVEAIERTVGESVQVTGYIGLHAIAAEMRGHAERANALGEHFDARAESLRQIKLELQLRKAVVDTTTKAIGGCLYYVTIASER
jgi:hypothetical protein